MASFIPNFLIESVARQAAKQYGVPVNDQLIKKAIKKWRERGSSLDPAVFQQIYRELEPELPQQLRQQQQQQLEMPKDTGPHGDAELAYRETFHQGRQNEPLHYVCQRYVRGDLRRPFWCDRYDDLQAQEQRIGNDPVPLREQHAVQAKFESERSWQGFHETIMEQDPKYRASVQEYNAKLAQVEQRQRAYAQSFTGALQKLHDEFYVQISRKEWDLLQGKQIYLDANTRLKFIQGVPHVGWYLLPSNIYTFSLLHDNIARLYYGNKYILVQRVANLESTGAPIRRKPQTQAKPITKLETRIVKRTAEIDLNGLPSRQQFFDDWIKTHRSLRETHEEYNLLDEQNTEKRERQMPWFISRKQPDVPNFRLLEYPEINYDVQYTTPLVAYEEGLFELSGLTNWRQSVQALKEWSNAYDAAGLSEETKRHIGSYVSISYERYWATFEKYNSVNEVPEEFQSFLVAFKPLPDATILFEGYGRYETDLPSWTVGDITIRKRNTSTSYDPTAALRFVQLNESMPEYVQRALVIHVIQGGVRAIDVMKYRITQGRGSMGGIAEKEITLQPYIQMKTLHTYTTLIETNAFQHYAYGLREQPNPFRVIVVLTTPL